jgi:transposase-like protein
VVYEKKEEDAMANPKIDMFEELFSKILHSDEDLLLTVVERLMSTEADALCNAAYGERSPDRTNRCNGYPKPVWGSAASSFPRARSSSTAGSSSTASKMESPVRRIAPEDNRGARSPSY